MSDNDDSKCTTGQTNGMSFDEIKKAYPDQYKQATKLTQADVKYVVTELGGVWHEYDEEKNRCTCGFVQDLIHSMNYHINNYKNPNPLSSDHNSAWGSVGYLQGKLPKEFYIWALNDNEDYFLTMLADKRFTPVTVWTAVRDWMKEEK